ncbi:hypothetical protein SDC9_169164 [bioreactor metagenome]|uniref:Uncharacterized protein n=1 Tax=bioreactor metagenome TaxID=1076179 RepID=A0A645GCP9_9ZZZZ
MTAAKRVFKAVGTGQVAGQGQDRGYLEAAGLGVVCMKCVLQCLPLCCAISHQHPQAAQGGLLLLSQAGARDNPLPHAVRQFQ